MFKTMFLLLSGKNKCLDAHLASFCKYWLPVMMYDIIVLQDMHIYLGGID